MNDVETLQRALAAVMHQIGHDREQLKLAVEAGDEKLALLWNEELELNQVVYQRLLDMTHAARRTVSYKESQL